MPSPRKWTTAAWRRCKASLISLRQGKKGQLAVACGPPPQIPAPIATLTSAPVWKRRNHAFRSTWDNATAFKEQNTQYYSVSLPRHFQSQATSLVPDSQRPSRSSTRLQVHLQCRCRSSDADPRACFPGCLGLEDVFFGPLLCDGTRGNKFRPIAPYATDWWFEMMSCAVRHPPSCLGAYSPSSLIVGAEKAKCILAGDDDWADEKDSGSSPVWCFSCDGEPLLLFPRAVFCRPPTRTEVGSMNLEIGDIDILVVCLAQDQADAWWY